MKNLSYLVLAVLVVLGGAVAFDCPHDRGIPTRMYTDCNLIKPVNALAGDEIGINCTNHNKTNNVDSPLRGLPIQVTGYVDKTPVYMLYLSTGADGIAKFTARVPGEYSVEFNLESQDITQESPVMQMRMVNFTVDENPVKNTGIVQSQTPSGAAAGASDAPIVPAPVVDSPAPPQPVVNTPPATVQNNVGPLDFVMNGTKTEQSRNYASNFVLMLVGLLIS